MYALHTQAVVKDALAQTQVLGGDLQKLIVGKELKALLKAHLAGRHKAQSLVGAGSAHIGQLLLAADVYGDILGLGAFADDHAAVDRYAGADEQSAAATQ